MRTSQGEAGVISPDGCSATEHRIHLIPKHLHVLPGGQSAQPLPLARRPRNSPIQTKGAFDYHPGKTGALHFGKGPNQLLATGLLDPFHNLYPGLPEKLSTPPAMCGIRVVGPDDDPFYSCFYKGGGTGARPTVSGARFQGHIHGSILRSQWAMSSRSILKSLNLRMGLPSGPVPARAKFFPVLHNDSAHWWVGTR